MVAVVAVCPHGGDGSGVMPGQKVEVFTQVIIDITPWWVECSMVRTCCRRDGGMTMRSL